MDANDCKVGDRVLFGRTNGQKTLGKIVKKNQKTAKIEQLEERGTQKAHAIGKIWKVPYELITPATTTAQALAQTSAPTAKERADEPISLMVSGTDRAILEAISVVYSHLSPENLSCDGELSVTEVNRRHRKLTEQLFHLEKALGRPVSEMAIFNWEMAQTA